MTQPSTRRYSCGGVRLESAGAPVRLALWLLLPAALIGCSAPPTQPEAGATGHGNRCRGTVLTEQIATDTVVQTATKPLATGAEATCDVAAVVVRAGQELICKRLLLPLMGPPSSLVADRPCPAPDSLDKILPRNSKCDLQAALVQMDVDGAASLQ